MTNFAALLQALTQNQVEFIIVGGAAATAHGAARLTLDLDIVYRRSSENTERLAAALAPCHPYLRGMPPGLPFHLDGQTIRNGLNFTLTTSLGDLDLLGEIAGGGNYEELQPYAVLLHIFGMQCQCLGLERLIYVKRAAGRPKDLEAIAELETMLEERLKSEEMDL
jgi:predicted nucleotidyltransferase